MRHHDPCNYEGEEAYDWTGAYFERSCASLRLAFPYFLLTLTTKKNIMRSAIHLICHIDSINTTLYNILLESHLDLWLPMSVPSRNLKSPTTIAHTFWTRTWTIICSHRATEWLWGVISMQKYLHRFRSLSHVDVLNAGIPHLLAAIGGKVVTLCFFCLLQSP